MPIFAGEISFLIAKLIYGWFQICDLHPIVRKSCVILWMGAKSCTTKRVVETL